ncbi:MAG TPA: hypothetical protein VKH61_02600, partial [Streptosporangiaceae bacterium]|nr:hypothetical protein [Streptosporangiaceae bacterium]
MQIKVPDRELQHTTDQLTADMPGATLVIQRFAELVDSVPTLRNYHCGMMDRLVDATAGAIAGSLGRAAGDQDPDRRYVPHRPVPDTAPRIRQLA